MPVVGVRSMPPRQRVDVSAESDGQKQVSIMEGSLQQLDGELNKYISELLSVHEFSAKQVPLPQLGKCLSLQAVVPTLVERPWSAS